MSWDTQLFLFDANGNGVAHMDDACSLQSALTNQFVSQPGVYFIGIAAYNNDPEGPNGLIWNNTPFNVERAPDGPGAPGPLINWSASAPTGGAYSLTLAGCSFGNAGGYFCSISGTCPGTVTLRWSGAQPNRQQGIVFASNTGNYTIPGGPCQGTQLGLGTQNLRLYNTIPTGNGSGSVNAQAGTAACRGYVQLIQVPGCQTSNVAQVP